VGERRGEGGGGDIVDYSKKRERISRYPCGRWVALGKKDGPIKTRSLPPSLCVFLGDNRRKIVGMNVHIPFFVRDYFEWKTGRKDLDINY
jgi:hypothetical protein